jgi:hypothetical protein
VTEIFWRCDDESEWVCGVRCRAAGHPVASHGSFEHGGASKFHLVGASHIVRRLQHSKLVVSPGVFLIYQLVCERSVLRQALRSVVALCRPK